MEDAAVKSTASWVDYTPEEEVQPSLHSKITTNAAWHLFSFYKAVPGASVRICHKSTSPRVEWKQLIFNTESF